MEILPHDRRDEQSDEALFQQYREHDDEGAFAELFRRYAPDLRNILARIVPDPGAVEDIIQTTFLNVFQKRETFSTRYLFQGWIRTIARNAAIDHCRRSHVRLRTVLDIEGREASPDSAPLKDLLCDKEEFDPAEGEAQLLLWQAVDALPLGQCGVIRLRFQFHQKYSEIAETLGIPVGTVKSRMNAAFQRLSETLLDYYPEHVGKPRSRKQKERTSTLPSLSMPLPETEAVSFQD